VASPGWTVPKWMRRVSAAQSERTSAGTGKAGRELFRALRTFSPNEPAEPSQPRASDECGSSLQCCR